MSGQFQPIEIPPGVVSKATKNVRSSNWSEVNLVRWVEGQLAPVGGQQRYPYVFASRCRAIHGWYDLAGFFRVAYVCEQHVYVDTEGTLIEITPSGGWPPVTPPGEGGYGDGNYGDGTYGTPRPIDTITQLNRIPPMWSVSNFGALLLVMYSEDGRLLQWDPASVSGTLLTAVPGAPKGRGFVVTPERFVMIFGQTNDGTVDNGSPRRFGWCNQGDITNWAFADVTSQAGFLDIEPSSPIITGISGRFGTLLFTAKKAYLSRYLALPYVYDYIELADACTPWSPASIATTSSNVLWMSEQGAYSYDGGAITPVGCAVRSWITNDIDPLAVRHQACMAHLGKFNEVWWFFPQDGQPHNTRVAIFNYKEGWWSEGNMSRSAGITSSYTSQVIMADGTVAYEHEVGELFNGADLPWAESFDLNLTSGTKLATLKQVIPDVDQHADQLRFSFFAQNSRSLVSDLSAPGQGNATPGIWTPPQPIRPDGYVDARVTGRDVRMKISVAGPAVLPFTLGQHLVDFAVRGDR